MMNPNIKKPRDGSLGRRFRSLLLLAAVCSAASAVEAGLSSELAALKKIAKRDASGRQIVTFEPFTKALPGDEIVYRISYLYTGSGAASNVQISGLVPEHMILLEGTEIEAGAVARYSVDGGSTFSALESLAVELEDGSFRPATLDDVDALRWTLDDSLAPDESGTIEYSVKLK